MSSSQNKKIFAMKAAPAWKRLLAYFIDLAFLFILILIFVLAIYGNDLAQLLENINKYGAADLIKEDMLFPNDMLSQFKQLTPYEQNMAYWMYIVQNKYYYSIFILNQILSTIYFFLFWRNTGQTIGARLLKIRVISPLQEQIPILSLLIRITTLKITEFAFGLPLLIVTNPTLKQRIHDSLSSTVVIEDLSKEEAEAFINALAKEDDVEIEPSVNSDK